MLISADQLLAHAVGDYVAQSEWMATEKTKRSVAALAHVATYTAVFLCLTRSLPALLVICTTHFVIDRWRLARYVCWAKNLPWPGRRPWSECAATGYPTTTPPWLAVWLMIIVDNIMHVAINGAALRWL